MSMQFFEKYPVRPGQNLEMIAKQVVEGFIIGLHKSPFHGFSVEFAEHRLYNPGESTKNIDWKVYARTDKLFSKRFEEETNLRCRILIDTSSSMYFPYAEKQDLNVITKLNWSSLAAASLMQLLKKQRDAFGLSFFDDKLYLHSQAKSSTSHYKLMLSYIENSIADHKTAKLTSVADAIHETADRIHKRSLVVIFSDMFEQVENVDEVLSALQHLKHNKHEVILFHTVDASKEIEFDFENRPYLFVDMETGERVKVQSHQVKETYVNKLRIFKEQLRLKCLQYKIDLVEVDIQKSFDQVLQQYLVKRSKML